MRPRLALSGVLLLAAAMRFTCLGRQSLDIEEAYSLAVSQQPVDDLLAASAKDVHPPLHLVLLHGWAGWRPDEIGARSLSAVAGVIAIWLVYLVGRRYFGTTVALLAALLGAVSPFHLWYSQETRPYSLVMLLTLGSIEIYLRAREARSRRGRRVAWSALAVMNALGLYLHYFFMTVILFEALLTWRSRRPAPGEEPAPSKPFAASVLGTGLFFLPWIAALAGAVLGTHTWSAFDPGRWLLTPLWIAFQFTIGAVDNQIARQVAPAALAMLVVTGCLCASGLRALRADRRARDLAGLWVLALVIVPFALAAVFNFALVPKYVIGAFPVFLWLAALGGMSLSPRPLGMTLFITMLCGSIYFASLYFVDPRFARDDWRGMAEAIGRDGASNEGILFYSRRSNHEAIDFYYRGSLPLIGLTDGPPLTRAETETRLAETISGYSGIWFVDSFGSHFDPDGNTLRWLDGHGQRIWASPVFHRGTRLYHFWVTPPK